MLFFLCVASPVFGQLRYSLTDLGDLPGGPDDSRANGMNDLGQVVGSSRFADGFPFTSRGGFFWSAGTMTDLGRLPGDIDFWTANGVNNDGIVVGERQSTSTSFQALRWDRRTGEVVVLPELSGTGSTEAEAVNSMGQIVGRSRGMAALWSGDNVSALAPLPDFVASAARDINDLGLVVGISENSEGLRATMWNTLNDTVVDLGDFPGGPDFSQAWAINNLGQVVGTGQTDSGGRAFLWQDGVLRDIGNFGPRGINDETYVVGIGSDETGRAGILWHETFGAHNIHDLVDASADGWRLENAFDINAANQIAGYGRDPDGNLRAFLLTPVPEPSTGLAFLVAIFPAAFMWRRSLRGYVTKQPTFKKVESKVTMQLTRILAILFAMTCTAYGQTYSLVDLGDLPGGTNRSEAWLLNENGQAAGVSFSSDGPRAFLWNDGAMTEVGDLPGGASFSNPGGAGLNVHGQIVGSSGASGGDHAFLWDGTQMTDLGTLPGYDRSGAIAINDSGQIVGRSFNNDGIAATIWEDGAMREPSGFRTEPHPRDINNRGQIVGVDRSGPLFSSRPFIWENGETNDIGNLSEGDTGWADAINELGQVVGWNEIAGETTAWLWDDGVQIDLGRLPGSFTSQAFGLNDVGQVVGISSTRQDGFDGIRAWVWQEEVGIQNLNDLVDESGSGWTLQFAEDVNNAGQIVGYGLDPQGRTHGFLLTPVPEPNSGLAMLAGVAALALRGRTRFARRSSTR